ncbi:MAG: hypothetical protein IPN01_29565 [Deltaproteobacteria bacterium]|nr:hypothetical protein [Deltaproteobacteria bacterium]
MQRLRKLSSLTATSLSRELLWYGGFLAGRSSDLLEYEQKRSTLENAVLESDWTQAWSIVRRIEADHGLSIHLLIWANAILQRHSGIATQKRMHNAVTTATQNMGPVNFIVAYNSIRNEPSVSNSRYDNILCKKLEAVQNSAPPKTADYLAWHLSSSQNFTEDSLNNVLNFETASPIIDMYETVLKVTEQLAPTIIEEGMPDSETSQAVLMLLNILSNTISGERERRLLLSLRGSLELTDEATIDKNLVDELHNLWIDIETRAASPSVRASGVDIASRAAHAGSIIDSAVPEREELTKLSQSFRGFHRIDLVGRWLHNTTSDIGPMEPWRRAWRRFAILAGAIDATSFKGTGHSAVDHLLIAEASSVHQNLHVNPVAFGQPHSHRQANLEEQYIAIRTAGLLIRIALSQGDRHTAARVAAAAYVQSPTSARQRLPIVSILDGITIVEQETLAQRCPAISILYDASEGSDRLNNFDTERRQTAETYVISRGVQKPSELCSSLREELDPLLLYFLREVCVESTLQKFVFFDSSREAMEDRLAICRSIHEVLPSDDLQAEMTSLVRRRMIQNGLRALARSRVFVDIPGVCSAARTKYHDMFQRYLSLASTEDPTQSSTLDEAFKASEATGRVNESRALRLPPSERMDLLAQIIRGIREEFDHGPEDGLGGYLSIRIRHGTLSNHLRAPLTDRGLLATRDDQVKSYTNAASWDGFLTGLNIEESERVRGYLRQFSEWYDNLIAQIAREWLQVVTSPNQKGMFDFSISDLGISKISPILQVQDNWTFEEFIGPIIAILTHKLDSDLLQSGAGLRLRPQPQY